MFQALDTPVIQRFPIGMKLIFQMKFGLKTSFIERNSSEGISLYIHLRFCESLCTFCGCNKPITKNHGVENPYIEAV